LELSQLIVQILDTLHFSATLAGACSSWAYWKACSVDFLLMLIELFCQVLQMSRMSEKRSKNGDFVPTWSVFQVEGDAPTNHFGTDS